jgi:putative heme-binding domain-containing protein
MMRRFVIGLACMFLSVGIAFAQPKSKDPNIADTPPLTPEEQLKTFRLPAGWKIQLVAAEPKIPKPINIALDPKGRIWVTSSQEYPFPAPDNRPGKDTVRIIEDFDDNGLARKVTTFADGLNIPIGVLPVPGGALVYSIPNIWFIEDNGGKAGKKTSLYAAVGHKDTHGMTGEFQWGLDGWVYACHGFSNTSTLKGSGPESITMTSGSTYRIKLDGSRIESFTRGQVNPFGLCFDPLGNLYSADCHTRPIYQLLREASYPSFGRPHDGLGFGPEMLQHDHGSTAIAGIVYLADDSVFPTDFQNNMFVGNVVTNRINRDRLERHGSTYKAIEMPDFLKCDDPWFRPVDIKLGPDGALYVADFYNRIIGHYEVPLNHPGRDKERGRIWRIVPVDENGKPKLHPVVDPATASDADVVKMLEHPNLTVRTNATHELIRRKPIDLELHNRGPFAKAHGLWVYHGQGRITADVAKAFAKDPSPLVRTHLMRVLAEEAKWSPEMRTLAIEALGDEDAFVKRAAVQGLAAHPSPQAVDPLLKMTSAVEAYDTHLDWAIHIALRDQMRDPITMASILRFDFDSIPGVRFGILLANAAPGVHSPASATFLTLYLDHLVRRSDKQGLHPTLVFSVIRYGSEAERKSMFDLIEAKYAQNPVMKASLVRTIQQAMQERGGKLTDDQRKFSVDLAGKLLADTGPSKLQEGIDLAQSLRMTEAVDPLVQVIRSKKLPAGIRKNAIAAAVSLDAAKSQEPLSRILLDDAENLTVREQVASALASINQPKAYDVLVSALSKAPAALQATIALGMAGSKQGGEKLLDSIAAGKASPRLLQDRGVALKIENFKNATLNDRVKKLTAGLPAADQRIQELIGKRKTGYLAAKADPAAGRAIFEKNCMICHRLANQGPLIGPQLDGVGSRGLDRLLEDILDPNRNVDQAFRSTMLVLDDGRTMSGLVLREEGQVIVLADAQGKEVRVTKGNVTERSVSQLSPMPADFVERVPEAEFNNLMAYLLSQRPKQ